MMNAFRTALAARLRKERPELLPAEADRIVSSIGDDLRVIGEDLVVEVDGQPYRFPWAWYDEDAPANN
jgi:hypothetical protein